MKHPSTNDSVYRCAGRSLYLSDSEKRHAEQVGGAKRSTAERGE